ncbi:B3 domain-containing transcription factor FUS3 [Platanthera guangdongensis]|uniref:B3 domain-containing transcription factor FUS3 n=1 Tax=Platanthera guangdongensis TaxID=2320717 RepID=A0ABR2MF88_9ASPA
MAGVIARRRSAGKAAHPDQSAVAATDLRSEVSSFIHRRKRTSMGHRRLSGHRSSPFFHCKQAGAAVDCVQDLDLNAADIDFEQSIVGLRFLLQKELRNSDVSSLGRIVLPRFWPNNKSRMYILENTGNFVKSHNLQLGDFIMLYKDDDKDKYVIRARDKTKEELRLAPLPMEDEIFDCIVPDILAARARYSDLYLPLADGMNMAFGLNCGFPGEFGLSYPDEMFGTSSTESILKLGSMGSLSLDEYSTDALI